MQRALETVRLAYDAFNRGDFDSTVDFLHPDVVWQRVAGVEQPLRGREAVRRFLAPDVFARQQSDVHELEIVGESILVDCTFRGVGRGSGIELTQRGFHLWRIRDGLVIEFHYFLDRDEAVQAALGDAA